MERYESVVESVGKGKDWALYSAIAGISPQNGVEKIREVFLTACGKRDDEAAVRYYNWLLTAVNDVHLLILVEEEGDHKALPYGNKEVNAARSVARAERARLTIALYNELPTSGKGAAREFLTENETRLVDIEIPTLLKTREAMLNEVAGWWRDIDDEEKEEADILFSFLSSIRLRFEEEKEILLNSIRKATGLGFPVPRLTQHLLLSLKSRDDLLAREEDDITRILAIARARNTAKSSDRLQQELSVLQHLEGCTAGVSQFLEGAAQEISSFDTEVRELVAKMKDSSVYPYIRGKIQVSYSDINTVSIWLEYKGNKSQSEEWWHGQFELARKYVLAWKQEHPRRRLNLALVVRSEREAQPVFSRTQEF